MKHQVEAAGTGTMKTGHATGEAYLRASDSENDCESQVNNHNKDLYRLDSDIHRFPAATCLLLHLSSCQLSLRRTCTSYLVKTTWTLLKEFPSLRLTRNTGLMQNFADEGIPPLRAVQPIKVLVSDRILGAQLGGCCCIDRKRRLSSRDQCREGNPHREIHHYNGTRLIKYLPYNAHRTMTIYWQSCCYIRQKYSKPHTFLFEHSCYISMS